MITRFNRICEIVDGERAYQQLRWPGHVHPVGSYLTYLRRYCRKAEELDSTTDAERLVNQLLMVDSLAPDR